MNDNNIRLGINLFIACRLPRRGDANETYTHTHSSFIKRWVFAGCYQYHSIRLTTCARHQVTQQLMTDQPVTLNLLHISHLTTLTDLCKVLLID